jgi:methyl-accepting chemotaxis protein
MVNNVKSELNSKLERAIHIENRVVRTLVILEDRAEIERQAQKIAAARKLYADSWAALQKFTPSEAARPIRAQIQQGEERAKPLFEKVIALAKAGQDREATELLLTGLIPVSNQWLEAIEENVVLQKKLNEAAFEAAQESYADAQNVLIAAALLSLVLSAGLAWVITRSITQPMNAAVEAAQGVAEGNLTVPLQAVGQDESAKLVHTLQTMQGKLSDIVSEVRINAASLATASEEIAQGNQDLSARTEKQASALEQTAASMEQLSATVQSNAEYAKEANQLAISASAVAAQGGEVVAEVVNTMKGINESSRQIADIISVIDGIAFQTNILALNAAVEAARAGDQGRGFAVVATEVRNLAGRSAQAAKEIKTLIGASVERVEHGTDLVDKAGTTMTEVVQAIQKVTVLMGDISAASREQSQGVSEVGEAIMQMDQVTQQNAAMVEEMAAAAASLNSQAQQLVSTVSIFTLNESASHSGGNTEAVLPARTRKAERAESRPVLGGPSFSA